MCLVVIFRAVIYGAGSVKLFEEEEMCNVVGCGHGGEGKAEMCSFFERFWETVRAAEDEGEVVTLIFMGFEEAGEVF